MVKSSSPSIESTVVFLFCWKSWMVGCRYLPWILCFGFLQFSETTKFTPEAIKWQESDTNRCTGSKLPDESLMQIPTTGGEFMKELNLIDDNFSCTDHKAAEMGHEKSQNKIQLELNDPLDAGTENGANDGPFNNTLIAEMEVDMYGLQFKKSTVCVCVCGGWGELQFVVNAVKLPVSKYLPVKPFLN
ncbi:hypothetical protein L1887_06674 [Cichorium endivia]|nr:hypothetical protein L1887_06674 [Cichorium endivia]